MFFPFDSSSNIPIPSGRDTIVDFEDDVDQLLIWGEYYGYESVSEVLADAFTSGGNVVIDLSHVIGTQPRIVILGIDDPSKLANDIVIYTG